MSQPGQTLLATALARDAAARCNELAHHAFAAAEFNKFDVAQTIKYNLNRLRGVSLITDEEQAQFSELADWSASGAGVAETARAIQDRSDASPLAVALAGIAATLKAENAVAVLDAAVVGALIQFGTNPIRSDTGDENVFAGVAILAAIGAAAATAAVIQIQSRRTASGTAIKP